MSAIKRDKFDAVFSDLVRERASFSCEFCGVTSENRQIECAHIYGRANKAVRWDAMNAVSLCHYHHRHFTANPVEFRDWLLHTKGPYFLDTLREKASRIKRWKAWEKDEMYAHYRSELKRLKSERASGATGQLDFVSYE